MFSLIKRKLSRAKSEVSADDVPIENVRTLSLSPSDEQIVSKLSFTPETTIIERPPKKITPSTNTAWSERTVFNNTDSGLLSLPTEILMFLQPYLSPSSEVALRHSCARFFNLYSTPSFYLSGKDRFEFCCMTERDQDPKQLDRLVCAKCRGLHPKSAFAAADVTIPPTERDCRQIWLCPHRSLGYSKTVRAIKAGVDAPFRVENIDPCSRCKETIRHRSVADRPEKGTSEVDLENPKSESLLISKVAVLQAPSPAHNTRSSASGMYVETFPAKDVSMALQAINFRICPHICLGDPFILSKFCRACINTQRLPPGVKGPPCISESKRDSGDFNKSVEKCRGSCYIRSCKTKFMFQARESLSPDASGKRQVWLLIVSYRWLGPLLTKEKDINWLEHTVDTEERTQMRRDWESWQKSRGRQCMPNWSICLLHPEDSNLR